MSSDYRQNALDIYKKGKGNIQIGYKTDIENKNDLSSVYTPGIAGVSELLAKNPDLARTHSLKGRTIAVVSDGSAVLGLGNIGPVGAIPVMEGKSALFKRFGGVDAFPICLDTQNPDEIIQIVKKIAPVFGGINLEDIGAPKCFYILERLQKELDIPVIHDDNQGTGVVVLAGIINALKVKNVSKEEVNVIINGAGAAGMGIFNALYNYGIKNIVVCDSKGAIYEGRQNLEGYKVGLSKITNRKFVKGNIKECIANQDIFIGVSKGGLLKAEDIKSMNPRPVIFALANPTPEIMPQEAFEGGAFIVATGRSDFSNQVNNVLAFPGIFKGALENGIKNITQEMLTRAAFNLASIVSDPNPEKIIPEPFDPDIVDAVSSAIK